jgi:hypothetical protein
VILRGAFTVDGVTVGSAFAVGGEVAEGGVILCCEVAAVDANTSMRYYSLPEDSSYPPFDNIIDWAAHDPSSDDIAVTDTSGVSADTWHHMVFATDASTCVLRQSAHVDLHPGDRRQWRDDG